MADLFAGAGMVKDFFAACYPDRAVDGIDVEGVAAVIDFKEELSFGIVFARAGRAVRTGEEIAQFFSGGQAAGSFLDRLQETSSERGSRCAARDPRLPSDRSTRKHRGEKSSATAFSIHMPLAEILRRRLLL